MKTPKCAEADDQDSDDWKVAYKKLSPGLQVFAVVAYILVVSCGFILLMAFLGGLFTLLAWPLHAWLALEWLPAFGVVVALFFAAVAVIAYFRFSIQLEEIRRASAEVGWFSRMLSNAEQEDDRCEACRNDDSDGDTGSESHIKIIRFDPMAKGRGKNERRKK
jgi:hypothetical protein